VTKTDTQLIPGMRRMECERLDYSRLAKEIAENMGKGGNSPHPCTFDDDAIHNLKAMAKAYSEGKLIPGLDDETIHDMKTFSTMAKKASATAYGLLVTAVVGVIIAAFGKGILAIVKGG